MNIYLLNRYVHYSLCKYELSNCNEIYLYSEKKNFFLNVYYILTYSYDINFMLSTYFYGKEISDYFIH